MSRDAQCAARTSRCASSLLSATRRRYARAASRTVARSSSSSPAAARSAAPRRERSEPSSAAVSFSKITPARAEPWRARSAAAPLGIITWRRARQRHGSVGAAWHVLVARLFVPPKKPRHAAERRDLAQALTQRAVVLAHARGRGDSGRCHGAAAERAAKRQARGGGAGQRDAVQAVQRGGQRARKRKHQRLGSAESGPGAGQARVWPARG